MRLYSYIIMRILMIVPTLFGLTFIVFILSRAGGPNVVISAYINPHIPYALQKAQLMKEFHLNGPLWVQYLYYLSGLLHGDWGYTKTGVYSGPVTGAIAVFLPNTIQLSIAAFVITAIVGIPLGTISGYKKDSFTDQVTRIIAFIGISLPIFWLAQMLSLAFATNTVSPYLNVLPLDGTVNPFLLTNLNWVSSQGLSSPTHVMLIDSIIHGDLPVFFSALSHLVLPATTLAFTTIAPILRYMRASVAEVLNQDFVRIGRSKGLPEKLVIKRYIRRNALLPVMTIMGLVFAGLLAGVVVIEALFDYPGMGYWAVQSLINYNTGGIMGVTLVFGLILVFTNLVVDIIYAFLDPRIRTGE